MTVRSPSRSVAVNIDVYPQNILRLLRAEHRPLSDYLMISKKPLRVDIFLTFN
jgi:hypothetical protein